MPKLQSVQILDGETASGATSEIHSAWTPNLTFQAIGTASGAGTAVVEIQGSLDGVNFTLLGTITLTLINGTVSDGLAIDASWRYVRAVATNITGPGASVDVWMGGSLPN